MKIVDKKQIILKPIFSEKTIDLYRNFKKCTFEVEYKSTKKQIATVFEELYGIKPESVDIVVLKKRRNVIDRNTYRVITKRKKGKKAYISIGDNKLDIFENIK